MIPRFSFFVQRYHHHWIRYLHGIWSEFQILHFFSEASAGALCCDMESVSCV